MSTRSKLQRVLRRRSITTAALSKAVGVSSRSIHNLACGSSKSHRARQRITNFLGEQVWEDVPVTQRKLFLGPHVEIESPTVEMAIEFANQFPKELIRRKGKTVRFTQLLEVTLDKKHGPKPSQQNVG
jgi:hypothetical protein